jgi:hypothetical protein
VHGGSDQASTLQLTTTGPGKGRRLIEL